MSDLAGMESINDQVTVNATLEREPHLMHPSPGVAIRTWS
jgi:hypothetical protein